MNHEKEKLFIQLENLKKRVSFTEWDPKTDKHFSVGGQTGFSKIEDAMGVAGEILDELEPYGKNPKEPMEITIGNFFDILAGLEAGETERLILKGLIIDLEETIKPLLRETEPMEIPNG